MKLLLAVLLLPTLSRAAEPKVKAMQCANLDKALAGVPKGDDPVDQARRASIRKQRRDLGCSEKKPAPGEMTPAQKKAQCAQLAAELHTLASRLPQQKRERNAELKKQMAELNCAEGK